MSGEWVGLSDDNFYPDLVGGVLSGDCEIKPSFLALINSRRREIVRFSSIAGF